MLEFAATLDPKCKPTAVVRKGGVAAATGEGVKAASWRDLSVEKRIEYALIKGLDEFAARDAEEARTCGRWVGGLRALGAGLLPWWRWACWEGGLGWEEGWGGVRQGGGWVFRWG